MAWNGMGIGRAAVLAVVLSALETRGGECVPLGRAVMETAPVSRILIYGGVLGRPPCDVDRFFPGAGYFSARATCGGVSSEADVRVTLEGDGRGGVRQFRAGGSASARVPRSGDESGFTEADVGVIYAIRVMDGPVRVTITTRVKFVVDGKVVAEDTGSESYVMPEGSLLDPAFAGIAWTARARGIFFFQRQ